MLVNRHPLWIPVMDPFQLWWYWAARTYNLCQLSHKPKQQSSQDYKMGRQMPISSQGRRTSLNVLTLLYEESLQSLRFGDNPMFLQGLNELLSRPSFVQFAELNELFSFLLSSSYFFVTFNNVQQKNWQLLNEITVQLTPKGRIFL